MSFSNDLFPESRLAGDIDADAAERQRLMTEFAIGYNGRHYFYDAYRYDRLDDAVAYAKLKRGEPTAAGSARSAPVREPIEEPDESQRALMATLGITYKDGVYTWGSFRYDRLSDAVNYARLQSRSPTRV